MNVGSGHDYASDEHLSLSVVLQLSNTILRALAIFSQPSKSIFRYLSKKKANIWKKNIALCLHIAMFIADIISSIQFALISYTLGSYN